MSHKGGPRAGPFHEDAYEAPSGILGTRLSWGIGLPRRPLMVVISVSISGKELAEFDRLVQHFGYDSRSSAVRDALYAFVAQHRIDFQDKANLVFTLIYDGAKPHHELHTVLHDHSDLVRTSLHNHLGDRCVDVLVVQGEGGRVHSLLDRLTRLTDIRVNATPL